MDRNHGRLRCEADMNNLDDLLASAISCYRVLLDAYTELAASGFVADGEVLERLVERMTPMMDAARRADQALQGYLAGVGSSYHHLPVMRAYRDLLAQVAERNQLLLGLARTHSALVAAEISELRAGKKALAGYRLPAEKTGQTLSEAY